MRLFKTLLLLIIISGCSKTIYVPVESVKTEYRNINKTDSIHIRDSVIIREKGDTIFQTRWRIEYRDRLTTDSLVIRDSIPVPYPVPEYVEKRLSKWQSFKIKLGNIVLYLLGCGFVFFFFRRRFF